MSPTILVLVNYTFSSSRRDRFFSSLARKNDLRFIRYYSVERRRRTGRTTSRATDITNASLPLSLSLAPPSIQPLAITGSRDSNTSRGSLRGCGIVARYRGLCSIRKRTYRFATWNLEIKPLVDEKPLLGLANERKKQSNCLPTRDEKPPPVCVCRKRSIDNTDPLLILWNSTVRIRFEFFPIFDPEYPSRERFLSVLHRSNLSLEFEIGKSDGKGRERKWTWKRGRTR